MNRTLAGTDFSASGVHAILEVGAAGQITAKELSEKLLLEKSTVSRLVSSLLDRKELIEEPSGHDARVKHIRLSQRGRKTFAGITQFAERQVSAALKRVSESDQHEILAGLQRYAAALHADRSSLDIPPDRPRVSIVNGYYPELIGLTVSLHADYYSRHVGFGVAFEAKVAAGLAEFAPRLGSSVNAIWSARVNGRTVGTIAIDGEDLGGRRAHLRWFIVDDSARGVGVGRELLDAALSFCDEQGFHETQLWTFKGLDVARRLYEQNGFTLVEEYHGDQWGREMTEQIFVRTSVQS